MTERHCAERPRHSHGFTVVEVLIAMLILVTVATAFTMALTGATRVQGAAKVKLRIASTAEQVYEEFRSDRSWMDSCPTTCDLSGRIGADILKDTSLDTTFELVTAEARAIDSASDKKDDEDIDGVTPDYYDITIKIQVPAVDVARLFRAQPYTLRSAIDRTGARATGSVIVQLCIVENQVDYRMSIDGCPGSRRMIDMKPCPQDATISSWRCEAYNDPTVDGNTNPNQWRSASHFVSLRPTTGSVGGLPGSATWLGGGMYLFQNVPVGSYTVSASPPGGFVEWKSHYLPVYGELSVQYRQRARALLLFRPAPTGSIKYNFEREVKFVHWSKQTRNATPWLTYNGVEASCAVFTNSSCVLSSYLSTTLNCWTVTLPQNWRGKACYRSKDRDRVYYFAPTVTSTQVWPGAADNSVWTVTPVPFGRFLNEATTPFTIPIFQTESYKRGNHWGDPASDPKPPDTGSGPMEGIPTGLNSPHTLFTPTTIDQITGLSMPNKVGGPVDACGTLAYTWVDPVTGTIGSPGTPCYTPFSGKPYLIKIRGKGECYTSMDQADSDVYAWTQYGPYPMGISDGWAWGGVDSEKGPLLYAKEATAYTDKEDPYCPPPAPCPRVYWAPLDRWIIACSLRYRYCFFREYQSTFWQWNWVDPPAYESPPGSGNWVDPPGFWQPQSPFPSWWWQSYQGEESCEGFNVLVCTDNAGTICGPIPNPVEEETVPGPQGSSTYYPEVPSQIFRYVT